MFQGYIKRLLFVMLLAGVLLGVAWIVFSSRFSSKFLDAANAPFLAANQELEVNAPFQEGKQYQKLPAKITTNPSVQQFISEDPDKIQVLEFFSYACFWCYRLHPYINSWVSQKPNNIVFYRFPIVFNKGWDTLAKTFYVVQTLGQSKPLDEELFTAIHKNNIDLSNEKLLREFFVKHGTPEKKFSDLYGSFEVNRAFARSNEISTAFQIIISPAIVLNLPSGSYLITLTMAGNEQTVVDVMNYLIAREKQLDPQD